MDSCRCFLHPRAIPVKDTQVTVYLLRPCPPTHYPLPTGWSVVREYLSTPGDRSSTVVGNWRCADRGIQNKTCSYSNLGFKVKEVPLSASRSWSQLLASLERMMVVTHTYLVNTPSGCPLSVLPNSTLTLKLSAWKHPGARSWFPYY